MFIVVGTKAEYVKTVPSYLYRGQNVVSEPVAGDFGAAYVIVDTGSDDRYRAEYLQGRLESGLFSAKLCESREEAERLISLRVAQR